jgi:very-short-patch-repair endonuclease
MDQLELSNRFKKILVNYTDECINELTVYFQNKKFKKSDVYSFLKQKYNIKGCPGKGQKNYWLLRGFSKEYAERKIKEYSLVYDTNSPKAISKRHGVTLDEAILIRNERSEKGRNTINNLPENIKKEIFRKRASNSLENCIQKYGEKRGKEIYFERKKKLQSNVTLDGFISRYGIEEGTKRREIFLKDARIRNTIQGYIEKYGIENAELEFQKTCALKSKAHKLQGYIERYGLEEGTKKFNERQSKYLKTLNANPNILEINKSKGRTFEQLVLEHGLDVALKIVRNKMCAIGCASKESLKVFIPFYKYLRRSGIEKNDIYFGISGSKEYFVHLDSKFVIFDFTILSKRIIIEFNGTTFHPKSPDDHSWKSVYNNETSEEAYKRDQIKLEMAKKSGFTVITIWSDVDHQENLKHIIETYEKNKNNI